MNSLEIADAISNPKTYTDPSAYDAIFAQLRAHDPVAWLEPGNYRPFWAVTKLDDILEVERQGDIFINEPRSKLVPIADEEATRERNGGRPNLIRLLLNIDGAEHREYRKLTQSWFMAGNIKKLEAGTADLAREFIDRMAAKNGSCDFVTDVAVWYPLRVIMTILGVPRKDEHLMLKLTQTVLGSTDPEFSGGASSLEARMQGTQRFFEYFGKLSEQRRLTPTDDLASVIANAQISGGPIKELEAMSYYQLIATAGHDTTSASIAGGLLALIQNPEELRRLRAEPELLGSAVDEILRWVTPVKHFFRTAREDYVLRGRQIKAGQSLMMCYASANRDEDAFSEPFRFSVSRSPNKHVAFGYGPHLCLGQSLAKMEIRLLFKELLDRVEDIVLTGPAEWSASSLVSVLKSLPITYSTSTLPRSGGN